MMSQTAMQIQVMARQRLSPNSSILILRGLRGARQQEAAVWQKMQGACGKNHAEQHPHFPTHARLAVLLLAEALVDLANLRVAAGADNNANGVAGGHVGAGEEEVLLVLVGLDLGNLVRPLDDRLGLACRGGVRGAGGRE